MVASWRRRNLVVRNDRLRKLRFEHLEERALLAVSLPGDYNVDGVVDAADYTVWRDNLNSDNSLPNDSIGGPIGTPQYEQWQANFGRVADEAGGLRLMENLGRGVVATRSSSSQVFVSWRSLARDPADLAFNLYRSTDGGAPTRLNRDPLTGGTNFTDTTANLSLDNSYFVAPVLGGVEQEASGSFTLPANSEVAPLFSVPLRNITGNFDDYRVQFAWVGDLDGNGEYDFVVSRVPTTAGLPDIVEAYQRDGALLWSVDMGPNSLNRNNIEPGSSALSVGHWDGVTVYDLDSDGRAEVAIRTANGVTFGDGATLSYPADDNVQFISVLDGMTGAERARIQVPTDYLADGPMPAHMGVGYLDGVHPSLVVKMKNRIGNGPFNLMTVAYDFDGELTQKWKYLRGHNGGPDAHQFRIIDVDQDGFDEVVEIGFVLNGDGALKYSMAPQGIVHGDRFHIGDLDPDRPGLEGYGVQQNNPSGLLEYYYDAATGEILHSRFTASGPGGDVGRGIVADIDPNHRGYEYWSFFGIHNSSTPVPGEPPVETQLTVDPNRPWPNFRIWWDGDVLSENLDGWKIEKWNPAAQNLSRLGTLWHFGASPGPRSAPAFYGDILGDWREEIIYEKGDGTELQIYTTQMPSSERIYSLAQNPAYRNALTVKGYMQSHMLDYYLGHGMDLPPTPNIQVLDFADNAAPTVATPAGASSSVVTGTTTDLSVLGSDDGGEAALTYTWATAGPAPVGYSDNRTNDAKNTTVTFDAVGEYTFTVTIRDAGGRTAISQVGVTVHQTQTGMAVAPGSALIGPNGTQQFTAALTDQFGKAMLEQPTFTWSVISGGGSISAGGVYSAQRATGSATVQAASGPLSDTATVTISTNIPPQGWWTMDETSGNVVTDSSGNGLDGEAVNGPIWVDGRFGNALSFDGSNDYVELPISIVNSSTGSVSMWIRTATNFNDRAHLFYMSSQASGDGLGAENELHVNFSPSENLQFYIKDAGNGSNDVNITSSSSYANNVWHHVVATWDINGNAVLYVDGAPVDSAAHNAANFAGSAVVRLGRPAASVRYYSGLMDDVRLFNVAISAAQVQALFNEGGGAAAAFATATSHAVSNGSLDAAFASLGSEMLPQSSSTSSRYSPLGLISPLFSRIGIDHVVVQVADDSNLIDAILTARTESDRSWHRLRDRDTLRDQSAICFDEFDADAIGDGRLARHISTASW